MKFKYLFIALIAVAGFFASCSDDKDLGQLDGIQLSQSSLSIPVEGGQVEFDVTSAADWKFVTNDKKGNPVDSIPAWINSSCTGGNAGTTHVVFNAAATKGANNSTFKLVSGALTQYITVIQGVLNPPFSTCAEILAGNDGETYKVKGTLTRLSNTQYGNWYINDGTGEVYVYGTLDANGSEKNFASLKLEEGDEVTIQGPRETYKGTPQLKNVTVLSYTKSLIKVEELDKDTLDKAGEDFKVSLTVKGEGVTVDIPEADQSWLSVKGIVTSGTEAEITFHANANAGGARSSSISFTSTKGKQSSTVTASITQEGSIVPLTIAEFNAAEEGTVQYRLTGVITKIINPAKPQFIIADYSGETTVYGLGEAGDFEKLGLKEGDIITIVAARSSFKGQPQTKGAQYEDSYAASSLQKISVADFRNAAESKEKFYRISGTIVKPSEENTSFDLNVYGNFALKDETGEVYVYGVSTGWNGEKKQAAKLGLKEGDKITIIGYRTSYKGLIQVGGAFLFSKGE